MQSVLNDRQTQSVAGHLNSLVYPETLNCPNYRSCHMSRLKLSFHLDLNLQLPPDGVTPSGPAFHRWLPNGVADAIQLLDEDNSDSVAVWFERRVKNQSGFLTWDRDGIDFDASIIGRQGKLDGGYLYGQMILSDLSDTQLDSLAKNPILLGQPFGTYDPDDPTYVKLARRIIAVLQPALARFIATLRHQYGQYWLEQLPTWNSRQCTLGTYCSSTLRLKWWSDERQVWCRFLPTPSGSTVTSTRLPGRGYAEFLTEADWRRLQSTRCFPDVSTEVQLLGQVTKALEHGEFAQAFVELNSALELAINSRLNAGHVTKTISSAIQSFENKQAVSSQAAVVLLLLNRPHEEIQDVLSAIKVRNKIVHEGYRPTEKEAQKIRPVMQTIRRILGLDELKSPALTSSNRLDAPDEAG